MIAVLFIIVGTFLRLMPHTPNFAPITATALFGGVNLPKKWALTIPLITMAISDYLLSPKNRYRFYKPWHSWLSKRLSH